MRLYFERWKFKHVDEEAFRSVCEEVSGLDLSEFFKQVASHDGKLRLQGVALQGGGVGAGGLHGRREDRPQGRIDDAPYPRLPDEGREHSLAGKGWTASRGSTRYYLHLPRFKTVFARPFDPGNEILDIYQLDNFAPRRRDFRLDLPGDDRPEADGRVPVPFPADRALQRHRRRQARPGESAEATTTPTGNSPCRAFRDSSRTNFGRPTCSSYHPLKYFGRECVVAFRSDITEGPQGGSSSPSAEDAAQGITLRAPRQEPEHPGIHLPGGGRSGLCNTRGRTKRAAT